MKEERKIVLTIEELDFCCGVSVILNSQPEILYYEKNDLMVHYSIDKGCVCLDFKNKHIQLIDFNDIGILYYALTGIASLESWEVVDMYTKKDS